MLPWPGLRRGAQSVGYTLWMDNAVKSRRAPSFGMTMVVYNLGNLTSTEH